MDSKKKGGGDMMTWPFLLTGYALSGETQRVATNGNVNF